MRAQALQVANGGPLLPCCWLRSTPLHVYIHFRSISTGWQVANEIAKPQVSI